MVPVNEKERNPFPLTSLQVCCFVVGAQANMSQEVVFGPGGLLSAGLSISNVGLAFPFVVAKSVRNNKDRMTQ